MRNIRVDEINGISIEQFVLVEFLQTVIIFLILVYLIIIDDRKKN